MRDGVPVTIRAAHEARITPAGEDGRCGWC